MTVNGKPTGQDGVGCWATYDILFHGTIDIGSPLMIATAIVVMSYQKSQDTYFAKQETDQ
jgi:hypothetical protein